MRVYAPDHRVTVRRAATGYALEDISADVLSVNVTKGYAKAAGGFQFVTTFNRRLEGKRYDEILKPNDVVHIELNGGDGLGLQSRMIGLVSRAARTVKVSPDQSVVRRVTVSGMDFGKFLIRHNCARDITAGPGVTGPEAVTRIVSGLMFSGTPYEITKSIYDKLLVAQIPWIAPYIIYPESDSPTKDDWKTLDFTILEESGPVWSAMKRASNEPWNALTTETFDGVLHVILEKYPFHPETGKLTRSAFHKISEEDIKDEDLGIDDSDLVNYVFLKADMVTLYDGGKNFPLQYADAIKFDLESIAKHGFLPFNPQTNFVPQGYTQNDQATSDIRTMVTERAAEFWTRNKRNHEYEMGSLVVRGMPNIKAGDGIVLTATNMEYFVEGYTEQYVWGETYLTSLQLTRGQTHAS